MIKLTIHPDMVYYFNHEGMDPHAHIPSRELIDPSHEGGEVHIHHYHGVRTERFTAWGREEQTIAIPWNNAIVELLLPDSIKERMINENTDDS